MSSNVSRHIVCRLLGGSGRAQLVAVPIRKLPALCTSFNRSISIRVPTPTSTECCA